MAATEADSSVMAVMVLPVETVAMPVASVTAAMGATVSSVRWAQRERAGPLRARTVAQVAPAEQVAPAGTAVRVER